MAGKSNAENKLDAVSFDAQVYKVQTLVDGGLRVTFDLPESAIPQTARLMELKRDAVALYVACAPGENNAEE